MASQTLIPVHDSAAERKRARERARYAANREERKAQAAAYRAKNAEKVKAANTAYNLANRDDRRAYGAAYREQHREQARLYAVFYRVRFAAKARRAVADWYARHPDAMRLKKANRRAKKTIGGGRLSADIVRRLMCMQRGRCAGCGVSLKRSGHHLDHMVALSRGGKHQDDNMQLLCPRCNLSKGSCDPIDWARRMGRLL